MRTREMESLLARYPQLSQDELAQLLATFPSISTLDKAVIMADEQLSERLDALYLDHLSELAPPRTNLALIGILIFFCALLLWGALSA